VHERTSFTSRCVHHSARCSACGAQALGGREYDYYPNHAMLVALCRTARLTADDVFATLGDSVPMLKLEVTLCGRCLACEDYFAELLWSPLAAALLRQTRTPGTAQAVAR